LAHTTQRTPPRTSGNKPRSFNQALTKVSPSLSGCNLKHNQGTKDSR